MLVHLSEYIHPDAEALLKKNADVVDNFNEIEKIDGIIARSLVIDREMIKKATSLKVIGKHGVGYNTIDTEVAREFGVAVFYTPTTNTNSVAEMLVGMILDVNRKIAHANMQLRAGEIRNIATFVGTEVAGKTLALIGMGNIARRLAGILNNGFGLREVVGYDPFVSYDQAKAYKIRKVETVEEAVRAADIVNISVPLTDSTKNLVDKEIFDCFNPSAILVNASRGGIVDENDLYDALVAHKLRAAAFDVFANEPPAPDNKLLALENFCATPHVGGNTEEALYRTGMEVVEETINVIKGIQPKHPVV